MDAKIKVDRNQERETTRVEEQRFSQGLKFGRQEAKTLKKEDKNLRNELYEESNFRNDDEDRDSQEEQFFMPNLANRKTKAPVLSIDDRESF